MMERKEHLTISGFHLDNSVQKFNSLTQCATILKISWRILLLRIFYGQVIYLKE